MHILIWKKKLKFTEYLKLNESTSTVQPENLEELKEIVEKTIKEKGQKCDLNFIDTSRITSMDDLFRDFPDFNGDISEWNTSKVTNMSGMFAHSKFNGDISKWDVSNVEIMSSMFYESEFNRDISKWDVSNVKYMSSMFESSNFNGDISKWDVSTVKDMSGMFMGSKFSKDISKWDVSDVESHRKMFDNCPLEKKTEFQPKL